MVRFIFAATAAIAVANIADARPIGPPPVPPPPVLRAPQEEVYGDWVVADANATFQIARTDNNAGSSLGVACIEASCTSFLRIDVTCLEGHKYPALVNAPSAAYSVELLCEKIGELLIYSLPFEGAITDAMSVGGEIGFAFPMKSGQFKVMRFSLTGAARASARASQLAKQANIPERKTMSDNSVL